MQSRWLLSLLAAGTDVLALPGKMYYPRGNGTVSTSSSSSSSSTLLSNGTVAAVATTEATTTSAYLLAATTVTETPSASATATYEFPTEKLGPMATLLPAIPSDHDGDDIAHLTPKDSGSGSPMHYSQESTSAGSAGIYAVAVPRWNAPSVVLDHSSFVTGVGLSSTGDLVIAFSDKSALEHALDNWNHEHIIFVTYTEGCGDYDLGQRCYFSASAVVFDSSSLSATATGQAKAMEELVSDVNLAWGTYGDQRVAYGTGTASATTVSPTSTDSPTSTYQYSISPTQTGSCVAPVDTKYGLPTACLGPYFDDDLDSDLGYLTADEFSYGSLVEGILFDDEAELTKRWVVFDKISQGASKLANGAKTVIKSTGERVKGAAQSAKKNLAAVATKVYEVGKTAVEIGGNIIKGEPNKFEKDFDKLFLPSPAKECSDAKTADEKKKLANACKPKGGVKIVESPWGDAILIKTLGSLPESTDLRPSGSKKQTTVNKGKFMSFYCVKCGLTGSLKTSGNITIVVTKGITDGHFVADLNLNIGVGLGIHAQYYREDTYRNNLYDVPVTPFTIGFASIGPVISIGTEIKYSVNMTGTALARADISLASAKYHYDWTKGGASSTGFTPQFKPTFEAEGSVELAVQFGVPVGLELAITTFNGCEKCKGAVGVETIPSIKAAAAVAVQVSYNATDKSFDSGLKPTNNCSGISTTLSVKNDVNAFYNGFGLVKGSKSLLNGTDHIIASYCIGNKTDGTKNGVIGLQSRLAISDEAYSKLSARDTVNSTSNGTQVYDLTSYVIEKDADLGFPGLSIADTPYNLDETELDGYWYSTLSLNGSNGEYTLATCDDGNLYIQKNGSQSELPYYSTCTTLWSGYEDVVLTTPNSGVLHYYNNTMTKVGVSRLRTADEEVLPATAVYVALTPFYYTDDESEDAPSLLAAIDTNDEIFFPAVCTYKNATLGAKVYLINGTDIDAGLAMLKSTDVEYSITNGEVDECYMLFLEITDRVDGDWAEYDDDAEEQYEENPIELEFEASLIDDEGDLELEAEYLLAEQDEETLDDFAEIFDDDYEEDAAEWDEDSDYEDTFGDYYDILDDDEEEEESA